jgi:hypothetical protein
VVAVVVLRLRSLTGIGALGVRVLGLHLEFVAVDRAPLEWQSGLLDLEVPLLELEVLLVELEVL